MGREQEKERARRRRNDALKVRAYVRRWMKNEWWDTLRYFRLRHEDFNEWLDLQVAMREHTRTPCSCSMCRNHRQDEGVTFQELKFLDAMKDQDDGE